MNGGLPRRGLLLAGTLGLGALASPGGAAVARDLLTARGFTHGVASGEPGPRSMLLWTRYVAASGDAARLTVEVSETQDFRRIVVGGSVTASPDRDWTARLTIQGLQPGRWCYYRFIAPDGLISPVGRTRTLPVGRVEQFGLGVFSCSNLPYGWFNAYAHASARDDLHLMVHNGDYIYEYPRGRYPDAEKAIKDRLIEPANETILLADYRLRYASYRADADLQRLHRLFPMVSRWDDHEIANDAWTGGAENHAAADGDWAARKAAAIKAYREWLPVSDASWTSYDIGDLATLFQPETRLTARSRRLDLGEVALGAENMTAAFADLRDNVLRDPARTLMGAEQEAWLRKGMAQSVRRGARWQVLTQQVVMGDLNMPPIPDGLAESLNVPPEGLGYLKAATAAAQAGLPVSLDSWGGFPAARARLLAAAQAADADLVVLSGDSHNAWAFDLSEGGRPAGVEFAGHSVTSPGFETYLPVPPELVSQLLIGASPELKWADTSQRGYLAVQLTPEHVTGEWVFVDTIKDRSVRTRPSRSMTVARGRRRFTSES
ncbi:alkaline phosphatase D family protein [Caulobacter mirabilis]|uniref:Alkaline phosphatase n=1 Tax=Caulobacter mirabilis TaxID=69666 RepID=A0A2D2B489_9CAUL|nr:alkaline phosphatase D family protein [Caulobacter mirabilis]ATQ45067.1 alkaline phosphatase [Caulobacter mirabilis]